MWSEDSMIEYLKNNLKPKRFNHSMGVRDTAVKLAKIYGEDINKARISGLIHDCAKYVKDKEMIEIYEEHGNIVDEVEKNMPAILHGKVGSYVAKEVMGVEDKDILNAIAYHTTGRVNMSLLEKIIYIADYIEPLRDFPGVDNLRDIAFGGDLDKALILSFNNTIKYVIEGNQLLHKDTIEARNYMLYNK
ncbi:phosphohydrolase [Clostridium novyi A str. 4552]|uniref:bis(5'-nucleosyl)-tetraphosphatase (symmetrical) n=1 Tax=Clostridium novyi A str. 4552 TaxID=1444289 RepID=A0A0A0IE69_CLONO|nr:bis(5'-nucleosyl)-tetraphosphatase (symmetrical) YqeK [Clostridium novyi]KGM97930.1 phosphohydrolase [Clostridium novyi A str. 4552]